MRSASMLMVGLLVAACACQKVRRPADCKKQAADLDAWLETLVAEGFDDVAILPSGLEPVKVVDDPAARPLERGPILAVGSEDIAFNGEPIVGLASVAASPDPATALGELRERLATETARWREPDGPRPPLLLEIDRRAPWPVVQAVANVVASAGWVRTVFVVEGKVRQAPPPPSPIDDDIRRLLTPADPTKAVKLLDEPPARPTLLERAFGQCPDAMKLFEAMAPMDHDAKIRALTDRLAPAVEACSCNVDFTSAKALYWMIAGRHSPHLLGLSVPLAVSGPAGARTISAPKSATWADASQVVLAALKGGGGPFVLVVE